MKEMKKQNRRFLGFLCFLCVLLAAAFCLKPARLDEPAVGSADYVSGVEGVYQYPVQPGTQAWVDLGGTEACLAACRVPRETLDAMTTEALVETAAAHPFNVDMYAFSTMEDGFRSVLGKNDALAALQERPDRHEALKARLVAMAEWEQALPAGQAASAHARFQMSYLAFFDEYLE